MDKEINTTKEWRDIIESQTNTLMGWSLYLGDKQAATLFPVANNPDHFFKFSASFDNTHYGYHGLNAETIKGAKEEVEKILLDGYSAAIERHTKITEEFNEMLQCLTSETN